MKWRLYINFGENDYLMLDLVGGTETGAGKIKMVGKLKYLVFVSTSNNTTVSKSEKKIREGKKNRLIKF